MIDPRTEVDPSDYWRDAAKAKAGDTVDPETLPVAIRKQGGGWVGSRYFVFGAHRDGYFGWKCLEVK